MLYIKNMKIDLQIHSHYSDGYHTPTQLAGFLFKQGIKVASLTDHNTVIGQPEFKSACNRYGIKTVPGLELYVRYKSRGFNLLWYNYDATAPELHKLLASTWLRRRRFAEKVAIRLKRLGLKFNIEKFIVQHPEYLPANHLADVIWASRDNRRLLKDALGLEKVREDDIMRFCLFPKIGPRLQDAHVSLTRVLSLRRQIGGQLIFCHPGLNNKLRGGLLETLLAAGVDGAEILSPHHGYNTVAYLSSLANQYKFIASGGSDFHKFNDAQIKPLSSWNWFSIDSAYLPGVRKILDNKK